MSESSHVMSAPGQTPGPITQPERIISIDVLRGFAVLGILIMNIQSFAMIGMAYINPTAYGDLTGANYVVWFLSHLFADQKFISIFSMLFGAGIVVMTSRQARTGAKTAGVHYRRMFLLLLMGLAHAHLLWYGDILYAYALCGMLVYLFRRKRPRTLLLLGLFFYGVSTVLPFLFDASLPGWPEEQAQELRGAWHPDAETINEELDVYRGGWLQQLPVRSSEAFFFETFLFLTAFLWSSSGLMLIGMGLFKLGVFSAELSKRTYATLIAVAVFLGLPLILFGVWRNFSNEWVFEKTFFLGSIPNHMAAPIVALGWVSVVMLICKSSAMPRAKHALAAVGRMALTCYLLETIICTTIFYGHGLGYFGSVSRAGQFLITVSVWTILIVFSTLWMRRNRFGPFEWAWRCATYWQWQPLRR